MLEVKFCGLKWNFRHLSVFSFVKLWRPGTTHASCVWPLCDRTHLVHNNKYTTGKYCSTDFIWVLTSKECDHILKKFRIERRVGTGTRGTPMFLSWRVLSRLFEVITSGLGVKTSVSAYLWQREIEPNRTEFQSNSIELNPWVEFDWGQSNEIELTQKIGQLNLYRTFDFQTLDFLCWKSITSFWRLELLLYNTVFIVTADGNPGEIASDALWVFSFKSVVKGYQGCGFDAKEGERFQSSKEDRRERLCFLIVNERRQLGHLQRELVAEYFNKQE